ncbi:pyridine nucleotide-disulfide oxidoreductase-domain-containing protein [Lineolata rhizophorae]|uniref:Pyridine nucleotide-disulfide oxidoreductase-domain-containing protein n=1 Tax=Lineolata rhizophorae TaxID=578093 RepID=A0A6A6NUD7_9PEZI|nr:pyridine nucleotide-disulfide oxidoreductase-domain-containing protein [Lineolata rhizophorae]
MEPMANPEIERERVVILGSGWAGYTVARRLDPSKYQAVIVSPRSYFAFTPLLASTSVGTLEYRTAMEPIRSKRLPHVSYIQGWADGVSFAKKTVTVEEAVNDPRQGVSLTEGPHAGETPREREAEKSVERRKGELFDLQYDKLVIAVGCYSQTFGTPGVKEHALFLKDVGDARKIRNRIIQCFETAALPTTSEEMRRHLLNFAIVGGGPTGIEFSAELHDIIAEDMRKIYPELANLCRITVYDVAPKVLSMFDEKLGKYATDMFHREGIAVKTSHHVEGVRRGAPDVNGRAPYPMVKDRQSCWTLKVQEEGDIGVGMVVWSTGLMMNPFVDNALSRVQAFPRMSSIFPTSREPRSDAAGLQWMVKKHPKTGAVITDDRLRLIIEPASKDGSDIGKGDSARAVMDDVFALGDCSTLEGTMYPATAQVASQKAEWLAKRLNKDDIEKKTFTWKNMGVMAYLGNWKAIMQTSGSSFSGRTAWLIWRGAYLTKSVSVRNKILIPVYWFLNWAFGRDISRF